MPGSAVELERVATAAGWSLTDEAISRFEVYLDTLLFWNARLSLTATATRSAIIRVHIADSLRVAPLIESGFRVADLGSGAGFPGVPLAIVYPNVHLTLIESRRKRANFLREVVRRVQAANVDVVEMRVEAVAEALRSTFDVTVSRAVWRLSEFLRRSCALLHNGGLAIAMKGARAVAPDTEQVFSKLKTITYEIHGGKQHSLLVYQKTA